MKKDKIKILKELNMKLDSYHHEAYEVVHDKEEQLHYKWQFEKAIYKLIGFIYGL